MADELNVPTHRWYEPRNNISLPKTDFSAQTIYASGIQKIDAWINSQPWGNPVPGLFALAEPGAWYDPSDLTTLFQDAAGTTPVTAAGQPVGLVLDKSQGLGLGSELRGTGGVTTIGSPGTLGTYNTSTGAGSAYRLDGSNVSGVQIPVADGRTYLLDVEQLTGTLQIRGNGLAGNQLVTNVVGRQTYRLFIASGEDLFFVTGANAASVTFFVHSVRELPGNHASQATAASRPLYGVVPVGGRRNLVTRSEPTLAQLGGQSNVSSAATTIPGYAASIAFGDNSALRIAYMGASGIPAGSTITVSVYVQMDDGGAPVLGTANNNGDFSVVAGGNAIHSISNQTVTQISGSLYRVSGAGVTAVADPANNGIVKYTTQSARGFRVTGYQIEIGSSLTNYQRVVSALDVTEAGVSTLSYLSFDGVDDALVTSAINAGASEMQIFAGVRKLSDAAVGLIAEFGTTIPNGGFYLAAPNAAAANYGFASRGTTQVTFTTLNNYTAPITSVVTGLASITAPSVAVRHNGSSLGTLTTSQGTGPYGNLALNIGRRASGTLPFNGRIYGLIVRFGANLDANTISQTETWVNSKTGAY